MEIINFDDIRESLILNMQGNRLIPVIGSGFTRNCKSFKGKVPSGEDYKKYMIEQIADSLALSTEERQNLKGQSFSKISELYHEPSVVSVTEQRNYLRANFTHVCIDEYKANLLSLPWQYIYTLNIDDGIEQNSQFNYVIHANREVDKHVFDEEKCVIKLHGDIHDMLKYTDSDCAILTQTQYANSLKTNASLLMKLEHDSIFQNLIFVGCSLDDEIDLLVYSGINPDNKNVTAKYYCAAKEPSKLDQIKLKKYGITHCVIFGTYENMYKVLFEIGQEAQQIRIDDLLHYKHFSVMKLSPSFEDNKPYLLFGKSLIDKRRSITLPYFFVSREVSDDIISQLPYYTIQIVLGSGCSGKSYILADLACRIRNKDVYVFETRDRLTETAFYSLIDQKNCVILADDSALKSSQIENLLDNIPTLNKNNIQVILFANRHDRDLNGIIRLHEIQGLLIQDDIPRYEVDNIFSARELNELNPLLTATDAGIFNDKKTIVDNIINVSEKLMENNKFYSIKPKLGTVKEIASLIALATEKKVYSRQALTLDLLNELLLQAKIAEPLIDAEATWSFEQSPGDNSPVKYVVNAEYWLNKQLSTFAHLEGNPKRIAEAYKYIVTRLIAEYGAPHLLYGKKSAPYRSYIMFDSINRIFNTDISHGKNGLALIRVIYENLNTLLSVDPNYMHQRAKCYIKSSYYERSSEEKLKYLDMAYRDANVSSQVFLHRYEESCNDKLLISIAHVTYTRALILCHKCNIADFSNITDNSSAISTLYEAMTSPYNSYDFAKNDSFNYYNVIAKLINKAILDNSLISDDVFPLLSELFEIISSD